MNPADFITAGVGIIEKLIELHKINEWFQLVFGFLFTFISTFSGACGGCLIAGHNFAYSSGWGLISATGAITALFFYNPKTKGIMIVQDKSIKTGVDLSDYQSIEKK